MTLSELNALESAYHILQPLDETARRRALQWLADALADRQPLSAARASVSAAERPTVKTDVKTKRTAVANRSKNGGRKTKQAASRGERPYRRMPEPTDIMNAYAEIGTISGLADHFDVPHYTVTHWARRLRGQGYDIGRAS